MQAKQYTTILDALDLGDVKSASKQYTKDIEKNWGKLTKDLYSKFLVYLIKALVTSSSGQTVQGDLESEEAITQFEKDLQAKAID